MEKLLRKRREAGSVKVAADIGRDKVRKIERGELSRGNITPSDAGRVATDIKKED